MDSSGPPELRSAFPDISFKLRVQAFRPRHTAHGRGCTYLFRVFNDRYVEFCTEQVARPDTLTFGHPLPKSGSQGGERVDRSLLDQRVDHLLGLLEECRQKC